ncbi:DUF4192 domain-containing protein [Dactylosporangium darangshiense]|uniref:DUF4192 domain-containing protein n=1 Tax=Dactylosporangium darangshiense TaxID=579108 RepID=A0ABP8DMW9_9ACTN
MREASAVQLLRNPEDLLGKIPYLLQYHPTDRIVVLYLGPDHHLLVIGSVGIDAPTADLADEIRDTATRTGAQSVVIVGYGPLTATGTVTSLVDAVDPHIHISYTCLVSAGAYYCLDRGCICDATTGIQFDPRATETAAHATVAGEVAWPSRSDLLALTEPDPDAQDRVRAAFHDARRIERPELVELDELLERAMLDQRLTDLEAARLALLLRRRPVREAAWLKTTDHMWQRNLWLDLTRRIPEPYVAAPAALAAWCCWMRGEGPLALAAARRTAAVDPQNFITTVVVAAIQSKLRPADFMPAWPPALDDDATAGPR